MNEQNPTCPSCGGKMIKMAFANRKAFGMFITADLFLAFGLILAIIIPAAGWIAGGVFIIIGVCLLLKVQKGWKCKTCDTLLPEFRIK